MNKEELIKEVKSLKYHNASKRSWIDQELVLELIDQLDEPQKPVVPRFVANWIEYCKNTFLSLVRALNVSDVDFYNYANQKDHSKLIDFLGSAINQETFALAWINGYEVEKEKRYSVKIKGEIEENLLVYGLGIKRYFFARTYDSSKQNEHTRKELENAGFGWVFDCPGVEVKEVK